MAWPSFLTDTATASVAAALSTFRRSPRDPRGDLATAQRYGLVPSVCALRGRPPSELQVSFASTPHARMNHSPTASVSQLRLISVTLLIGPLLFAGVVGWLLYSGGFEGPQLQGTVPLALVGVAAASLVLAVFL